MHENSVNMMKDFIERYEIKSGRVIDIGSCDVNGSYRGLFPKEVEYIGVDIIAGKNVDILMDSDAWRKLENVDVVISGQTFEHVEDLPELLKKIFGVLKPDGLLCAIAPSTGVAHDYPIWMGNFSQDRMRRVVEKAGFKVIECLLSNVEPWKDVRCVAKKEAKGVSKVEYRSREA